MKNNEKAAGNVDFRLETKTFTVRRGALIAVIGAIAGAFGGYQARVRLVRGLRVPDAVIAIPEDLLAIGLGLLLVSRF